MDLHELEYFITITQEKNLTHAAEKLFIGQPTLSKYLQRTEEELGTPLFSRCGRTLELTYAGERYLSYAIRMLSLKHELEKEMQDIRSLKKGSLRVGMPPVRCSLMLPLVLPLFHKKYPDIGFRIIENNSEALDALLLNGTIDIAIYNMFEKKNGLSYEVLMEDHLYAVVRKNHPIRNLAVLNEQKELEIRLEWLQDEVFLLQNASQRQGSYMLRSIEEAHIHHPKKQEHSNIQAAMILAADGYGVAFVSGYFLKRFQSFYTYDYYAIRELKRPIHVVAGYKEGSYLPLYTKDFISIVKAQMQTAPPK